MALARQVAKQGGDSTELEKTTHALAGFDKSKTGGKACSNLMKKRNASKIIISAAERAKYHELTEQRKKREKERDGKLEKKKTLSKKLESNTLAKRLNGNGWFVQMDHIFVKHGVKRYHKVQWKGKANIWLRKSSAEGPQKTRCGRRCH